MIKLTKKMFEQYMTLSAANPLIIMVVPDNYFDAYSAYNTTTGQMVSGNSYKEIAELTGLRHRYIKELAKRKEWPLATGHWIIDKEDK